MIIKGSKRAGAKQLANHLLNARDNEHVLPLEVRGFMTHRLDEALNEIYAQSRANTRTKKFLYSASLNPPADAVVSDDAFIDAANRTEAVLGLQGQPRVIVVHEKEGRRHAHAVWSRIDENLKAIEQHNDWPKLMALSRDIYLERSWKMPRGLQKWHERDRSNYTLSEHQAAKRRKLNPREVKARLQSVWQQSDNLERFQTALSQHGYQLAQGDKPIFMLVDRHGDIKALHRALSVKMKDVKAKIGPPDGLQSVEDAKARIKTQHHDVEQQQAALAQQHQAEIAPLKTQLFDMKIAHRKARQELKTFHEKRQHQERTMRQAEFKKGLKALWHWITGRQSALQRQHQAQYKASLERDKAERHALIQTQLKDRAALQTPLHTLRKHHQSQRLALQVQLSGSSHEYCPEHQHEQSLQHGLEWGL